MPEGKINPVSIADLRPGQVAGDPDWNLSIIEMKQSQLRTNELC